MSATRTLDHITRDHQRLLGCHPDLTVAVMAILDAMDILGFPMMVTEGLRSTARQKALYDQGRTKPGHIVTNADGELKKSNHQAKPDGFGYAVDCAFLDDPATPQPETFEAGQPWDLFGLMAEKKGLTWGGRWVSLVDKPHVELPLTH
jgi:peptidoglycan L-alanyl-D-glutamate endopeptidase CwlK